MSSQFDKTKPPQDHYLSSRDFVHTFFDPSLIQQHYIDFLFEETVYRSEPKRLEQNLDWAFVGKMQSRQLPNFVVVIPHGRVVGDNGNVISPDNRLIWDVSFEFGSTPPTHTILSKRSLPQVTHIPGTVAVLTSNASFNYYHWMFEVLARIYLLHRSGIQIDKYVINPQRGGRYQAETLEVLGIPKDKLVECRQHTHIEVERLVVPSLPGYSGHPPKWACHYLRNELYTKRKIQPVNGFERIYISRADAAFRKVLNETDVIRVLSAYGFKSVKLEYLTVYEQAKIFSSAKMIVSPHGAGLTNLLFCQSGTKVVELFSPHYSATCYFTLSNQMGLDYYYLFGEGIRPSPEDFVYQYSDNITVDTLKLRRTLNRVFTD